MPRSRRSAERPARTTMRRRDRAMDDAWIREFLHRAPVGYLASTSRGQPFINANLFVFDEAQHTVYLHTAREGRTQKNLSRPTRVCFAVSEMGRLLPADTALEFSVEFAGVVVFGMGAVTADPDEARVALQALLDKYAPHLRPARDYRAITDAELQRTTVYRIAIEEWSGKRKVVEEAFPGAFRYALPLDWWKVRSA